MVKRSYTPIFCWTREPERFARAHQALLDSGPPGYFTGDNMILFTRTLGLLAEDRFFAARGLHVLELPTGQGMVIR